MVGPAQDPDSCDLHVHTTASDGQLSPHAVVALARAKGLRAIGIADHDTTAGLKTLFAPGEGYEPGTPALFDGVEVVPAVELNSKWKDRELHILGYFIPVGPSPLEDILHEMRESRRDRVSAAVKRLRALGMPVEESRVFELATGESVGRPHIAMAMLEKGYVTSVKDAFDRFLGIGRPAHVERAHLDPVQSIRAVRDAGGVPVWAHPGTSRSMGRIADLVDAGLLGIEAFHPEHDARMRRKCVELAREYNLIITGGSDFHGPQAGEGGDLGSVSVPYDVVTQLREARRAN